MPGGHLVNVDKIEDYPGFADGVAGYDLGPSIQEQAANAGAEFELAEAHQLLRDDAHWQVTTSESRHRAKAVVVALGSRPKELGIPGETRLFGRGVSHCATCDGPLFRGKAVAVIGGGDSAVQEALTLARFAARVTLLHRGDVLAAQATYVGRALAESAIEVRYGILVQEILGDEVVSGIRIGVRGEPSATELPVAGVFPYVGLQPNTGFLLLDGLLPLDPAGHIATDVWMRTALPGLFAAGDVRQDSASQAIAAAGDGATAAIAAHRYIAEHAWS